MKVLIPYVQDPSEYKYLARYGEVVDAVPVVRQGGLSPAFYLADDEEPDAYLIDPPKEAL